MAEASNESSLHQNAPHRRTRWSICLISVLLSIGTGVSSIQLAREFQLPITGPGGGGRDPYWFIDKQINLIGAPILFSLAAVGVAVCWRRPPARWLAVAGLVFGVTCWVGAALSYP